MSTRCSASLTKTTGKNLLLQACQAGISTTSGNVSAGWEQLLIQGVMHFPTETRGLVFSVFFLLIHDNMLDATHDGSYPGING